ncbi:MULTISPECIES: hypothetical protein [unclassified Leptolyngbya]|uniref:hypothetical protein n=1 Tax=unclassified Leptolyngbya TaxID=2650499 RepID=UPI001682C363|nr:MULTISPECIES: hypothetical protein [unclassified Leptolyngbya]MBD1909768.1 hypothetical protein [Leptolyngbya sp. FACHB-8]MBD2157667.1 hypothetical protein [Leptolyngbya sp. FACHB-16]
MSSSTASSQATSPNLRPSRPYQPVVLYWDTLQGINGNGEGPLATRKQLQDAIALFARNLQESPCAGVVPGVVVQLSDGLYWLSPDWQVLCL